MMEDCMIVDDRPVGRRSLWQSSVSLHRYFSHSMEREREYGEEGRLGRVGRGRVDEEENGEGESADFSFFFLFLARTPSNL